MIRAAVLALAVLLAPAAAPANPRPDPGPDPVSTAVRLTITTRDIEATRRFYVEGLGYAVRFDGDITNADTRVLLGLRRGERARFIVLDSSRVIGGRKREGAGLGLLGVSGRALARLAHPRGNRLASGETMLAIVTSDVGEVAARLRRLGAPILAGPVTGHDGHQIEIVTRDPDGTRIHIVEER